ncbi:MAG: DUF554 domain-containing protein [Butyrivibrio sp.]
MKGLGTIVNVAAVILGGVIGMIIKRGLKERISDTLTKACGISVIFIGVAGALSKMFVIDGNSISTDGTLLLVLSLVFGGIIGELINIEKRMDGLGNRLKKAVKAGNDSNFVEGFVAATLVVCIGAMAIVGALQDGLTGDHSMLFTKAILDFIIVMVIASATGIGAVFSAVPLGIYQGLITLCAVLIEPLISDRLVNELSMVGSVLIFCVGINLIFDKKIRVGNLLPALLVPIAWEIISYFI